MTLNEVAPPGFGHTKGDKKKGIKKGGTAAAFDRARKEGRFKGSKSDMFAIMWSQKKKGDKPHYKPGTNKKYKKYQESVENGKVDLTLKTDVNNVLKQDNKEYDRGLLAQVNKDGSYDVAYWYDKYKAYPVEVEIDGKTCAKDAKNIHIKFHPELKKEEASYKQRDKELKKAKKAMDYRHKTIHKGGDDDVNEATTMRDNNLFGNAYAGSYETLKKKIGSKKKHNKPAFKEGISYQDFMKKVKG